MFYYTYVLKCSDDQLYIGSTKDLRRRIEQHEAGEVPATPPTPSNLPGIL